MPGVDAVIVSYNSADHLRACVERLAGLPDVQVVVVDNASSDGSLPAVADLPVRTVPLAENRGFAHGCNAGWRLGAAPFVLFLNPDATIDGASLARLVAALESAPSAGVAAPRIVGPDGALDFSQRRFPRLRTTYAQAFFLHRLFAHADWSDELVRDRAAYERAGSPDWASGACLLVRRDVLERVDGLDEGFFLYCEDLDLCRRIRSAGFEVLFEPEARVVHEGGASRPRAALLSVLAASRIRYAWKHQPAHVALLEQVGVALGAATHAAATKGGREARRGYLKALTRALSRHPRTGGDTGRP